MTNLLTNEQVPYYNILYIYKLFIAKKLMKP